MNKNEVPRYRQFMPGCLDLSESNHAFQSTMPYPGDANITSPRQQEAASVLVKMNTNISDAGYYISSPSVMAESPTFMSPTYPIIQQKPVFIFDQQFNTIPTVCNTTASWHSSQISATVQQTQNVNVFNVPWNQQMSNIHNQQYPNISNPPSIIHHQPTTYCTPVSQVSQPVHRQPFAPKENLQYSDSNNKLRSAIFDKILGSFPKLQHLMTTSNQRIKKEPVAYNSCVYNNIPTRSSLASDIMEEENDMGYCSFNDISPVNSALHSPTSSIEEQSSPLNQILEDVLNCVDDLKDLKDLVSDIDHKDDYNECVLPPKQVIRKVQNSKPKPRTATNENCETVSKKFQCIHCDKNFATRANLNIHVRSHSGERPHKCNYCGKCFTQKSTLRTHTRIHTGEKPYKCKDCSKAFTDYSTFTKHCRTHTGERPYTCDICNKGFAQSGNMIRHKQMHFKN